MGGSAKVRIRLRSGDTLWSLSRLFQVPLSLIVDSNPNIDPGNLEVGQTVQIPGYTLTDYTVMAGDTLWQIAQTHGIPLESLFLVEPDLSPDSLQIGQILRLPVRVTSAVVQGQRSYTYADMMNDLQRLSEIYPFMQLRTIGNTVMGKSIPELQIGRGEKRVHMNGSFHANEWITTPILMRFLNDYLLALTNQWGIRGLSMEPYYELVKISMVPMVNPDGVDLVINGAPEEEPYRNQVLSINEGNPDFSGWKANIRGVDLNDQFPANWEIEAARREHSLRHAIIQGLRRFPSRRLLRWLS